MLPTAAPSPGVKMTAIALLLLVQRWYVMTHIGIEVRLTSLQKIGISAIWEVAFRILGAVAA